MKLAFRPFGLKLVHTWAISRSIKAGGGTDLTSVVLVKLTDGSATGLGEASCSKRHAQSVDSIQSFLRLVNPQKLAFDDIPASMDYLEKLAPNHCSAKCALNLALVDGAARKAGQPVYDLFGLGFREDKHLTSLSIGIDSPAMIRRKVAEAAPFPILKLKIGAPGEKENLAALRAVDSQKTVRVDANEGWRTKEEALQNLEWLAQDPHIEFVEQPMPASTPARDLAWLKSRSPLPLFGDESCQNAGDVAACAEAFHGLNVKLVKAGGITPARDTLLAARRAGLKTMIGCMIETSLLISAAAHLAELADHLDIDGNLLISNDPFAGATAEHGVVSFARAPEPAGLRVKPKNGGPFAGGANGFSSASGFPAARSAPPAADARP